MSHPNSPEYFTISTVNQYDGATTVLAICEDMDAVMWRMKQCYTTCGDEYIINCYHLTTAKDACEKYTEQMVNRRKYEREKKEKEAKLKAFDELSDEEKYLQSQKKEKEFEEMMDYDPEMDAASYT